MAGGLRTTRRDSIHGQGQTDAIQLLDEFFWQRDSNRSHDGCRFIGDHLRFLSIVRVVCLPGNEAVGSVSMNASPLN
jgi:hypothetical protein